MQVGLLASEHASGCICGAVVMGVVSCWPAGEGGQPRHPSGDAFWQLLELDFPVLPLSVVVRKECFDKIGMLNVRIPGIDDWDLFVRIAEQFRVLVDEHPVGIYRSPSPRSAQGSSAQAAHLVR